ncbi:unnamed protein product [Acanthoscelides obtectus]|uniref:Uncharacterized protein n=1 Tax=Acanthoscelides obtectus TaxID=200917 RepID=A0A9P0M1U7_ACAOB|nr:unnamed protein product [Acanthoscelides obtectus]CAK1656268.1 hypothetical protein AOBTE_LOCUS19636 [Acanthoscelides obtectus]
MSGTLCVLLEKCCLPRA